MAFRREFCSARRAAVGFLAAVCVVCLLPAAYVPSTAEWWPQQPAATARRRLQCSNGWDLRGVAHLRGAYAEARQPVVADAFEVDGDVFVVLNLRPLPASEWKRASFSCVFGGDKDGTVASSIPTWDPTHGLTWLVRCRVPSGALGSLDDYDSLRTLSIVSRNPKARWRGVSYCRVPPADAATPLVACTSIKNVSTARLVEWIAFHQIQGYDHIFVYSNEPQEATAEALEPYVAEGLVTVVDWDFGSAYSLWHDQQSYIASCVHRHRGGRARLVGIFDIDEYFLVPGATLTASQRLLSELDANRTLEAPGGVAALSAGTLHFGPGRCPRQQGLAANATPLLLLSSMCARHEASTYRTKCHFVPDNVVYPNVHDAGGGVMHLMDPEQLVHAHLRQACQGKLARKKCYTDTSLLSYVPKVEKEVLRIMPESKPQSGSSPDQR
eukprot:m51a1_g9960 hypothetical protein (440) ;mRNA; r:60375-62013